MPELIVFPTELALRRFQQDAALELGFVDASCHLTFARLRALCLPYANIKGERMDAARQLLVRKQVVEVASGHFAGHGALGELSANALGDVLDQLIGELATLPGETPRIIDWLLDHHRGHKLYQLGTLISVWRANIKQDGLADQIAVNHALLRLLKGPREKWPPLLRGADRLTFKSIRWFNPFEESCVVALNQKLKVRVESALPLAHAEAAADRLGQRARVEIMAEPWAAWAEDLGDALAVDSPDVLQLEDSIRIDFSRSAGAYGEIEDLARRIRWVTRHRKTPANRIALVVPNIGSVQDIVPHVFSRFRIPYYFRRGRPVLSSPVVKAFLAWIAFPLRPERDVMIDLVRDPALRHENREAEVERLLKQPPRLDVKPSVLSAADALRVLTDRVVEPEDHFNAEALSAVRSVLEKLGAHVMPISDLLDLIEELLEDATIRPRESHEQGVWILNPRDAVGLSFDLVLFAGLNEGEFPGTPRQDALLNDKERHFLRLNLEERGSRLPKMALPEANVLFEQESVLFLAALGMAREQLVFSFQSVDQEGNEKGAGEYYRKLWNLAGWPAADEIQLSPYDQWRVQRLRAENIFSNHWNTQQTVAPEDRAPMPGESFLPIVPLPLCLAKDEALQSAACGTTTHSPTSDTPAAELEHLVRALTIEAERDRYLETPIGERAPSIYCGHVPALKEKVAAWLERKEELSPTALEDLARCRFVFLLERVFGIRDARVADDSPDPMDRGGLIHSILREVYTAIALGESGVDAPRRWAVKTASGWMKRAEGGVDAIPLANFVPESREKYLAFARKTAEARLNESELGHPGVWAAERAKIMEMVLNFVRHDVDTCATENRFPALFELKFGGADAVDLGAARSHGIIDRVDLVFAETNELKKVRVLDYKGSSRARNNQEEYIAEIVRNLDCQLPVYAFAAQKFFFDAFNTSRLNAMTEAGYLFYERDGSRIASALKKSLIPMDEEGLAEGFLATLSASIERLKAGDFAVDPLIKAYTDHSSVCRVNAVALADLD